MPERLVNGGSIHWEVSNETGHGTHRTAFGYKDSHPLSDNLTGIRINKMIAARAPATMGKQSYNVRYTGDKRLIPTFIECRSFLVLIHIRWRGVPCQGSPGIYSCFSSSYSLSTVMPENRARSSATVFPSLTTTRLQEGSREEHVRFHPGHLSLRESLLEQTPFVAEPFAARINRPEPGNAGLDLLLRWYPPVGDRRGLFFDVGAGAAYTTISIQEQGTHLLGILVGGIGLQYDTLFIEDRSGTTRMVIPSIPTAR